MEIPFSRTAEYIKWISAEGLDHLKDYPGYDTKPSDGEAPAYEI